MSLALMAGPLVEPVTLSMAKAHLRVDGATEDAYIGSLIETSRLQIEAALGLALVEQRWRWTLDQWPADATEIPLYPVLSVETIAVKGADGALVVVPPSAYHIDVAARPSRVVADLANLPAPGVPADGISVEFTAGFGAAAADVPAPIRQAVMLLVAHWFECREPAPAGSVAPRIPDAVSTLLAPYRVVRL